MITLMSEQIRQFRNSIGLNKHELAKKIGVSDNAVYAWEHGHSDPSLINCISLADVFGISLDQLVGRNFKPKEDDVNVCKDSAANTRRNNHDRDSDMARSSDDPISERVHKRSPWRFW